MNLGKYEIQSYNVLIDGQTVSRQKILYFGNNEEYNFAERYYGTIRDGYSQNETSFDNLLFSYIKTHIQGDSIVVVNDSDSPQVYITLSSIVSIQTGAENTITIILDKIDPIILKFVDVYNSQQAYSVLNYLLANPSENITNLDPDTIAPEIVFNNDFYGASIVNDSDSLFIVNLSLSIHSATLPLSKEEIISGLIYYIIDERDGEMSLSNNQLLINDGIDSDINSTGDYLISFGLVDLGGNQNNKTVLISISN